MALRLDIVSDQRQRLGGRASIVFGVAGGSIGRAADNDWILPDPQRYLSGHHARIHFRQGAFYLEDTSSNGVYVNDSSSPQGRRGLYALRNGDTLRMGEYRISVSIDVDEAVRIPGVNTSTLSVVAVESVTPLEGSDLGEDDLGASLNIEALIIAPETAAAAKLPPLTYEGSARVGSGPDMSAQERLNRLRAAARARLEGGAAPLADVRTTLQAFCRGAGIDPAKLPMESEAQSLHLAGRMFREMLLGLKEILRAQQSFSDRYHIETDKPEGRSPLDQATDDYLIGLFAAHERREFDPVMRLRGFLDHAGEHAAALEPALRAALVQFMAHLSPSGIEARVADNAGSLSPGSGAAANWERYKEVYGTLLQSTGQELPHLFTEAFAQAFVKRVDEDSGEAFKPPRE
jgi:type VI secretion system FHA domain protein